MCYILDFSECVLLVTVKSTSYFRLLRVRLILDPKRVCFTSDSFTPDSLHVHIYTTSSLTFPNHARKPNTFSPPKRFLPRIVCMRSPGSLSPSFTQRETLNNLTIAGNPGGGELPPPEEGVVSERELVFICPKFFFFLFSFL